MVRKLVTGKTHNVITDLAFSKVQEEGFGQSHLDALKEHCSAGDIDVPQNWREVGITYAPHLEQFLPEDHRSADDAIEDIE